MLEIGMVRFTFVLSSQTISNLCSVMTITLGSQAAFDVKRITGRARRVVGSANCCATAPIGALKSGTLARALLWSCGEAIAEPAARLASTFSSTACRGTAASAVARVSVVFIATTVFDFASPGMAKPCRCTR